MRYKKISDEDYNIHFMKNNRYHTIEFAITFTEKASKEIVTYRNALISLLTYATEKYDSTSKLTKKGYDLYSLYPKATTSRYGNLMRTKFSISILDAKFIDKNNILENILLLKEIVLNPLTSNNGFLKKYFNLVKHELEIETLTIEEEPRLYANCQLLKSLSKNENYALTGYSDMDILKMMDEKKVYQSYLAMLENSKIDFFISGNITNEKEIVDCIRKNFVFKNHFWEEISPYTIHCVKKSQPVVFEEERPYQQSKLSIAYKCFNLTDFESKYVLHIFNLIFGSGGNPMLMRFAREENGLCYYITSYYNKLDNLLILNSGIMKNNFDKILVIINEILDKMRQGKFSDYDLESARNEFLADIENLESSNVNIVEYMYGREVFNSDDMIAKRERIKAITKKDIMEISKKINIDTVFFLKGEL